MDLLKLGVICARDGDRLQLSANVYGTEAQNHMATRGRTSKAKHRTKSREHQQLVELVAHIRAVRSRQNLVTRHSTLRVDRNVKQ